MGENIKPCWSCGSTDLRRYRETSGSQVYCPRCLTGAADVKTWNTRAAPDDMPTELESKALLDYIGQLEAFASNHGMQLQPSPLVWDGARKLKERAGVLA